MRSKHALSLATLGGLLMTVSIGCGQGTEVSIAKPQGEVKPSPSVAPSELKGAAKNAVGPGTSYNMKRNPGASN